MSTETSPRKVVATFWFIVMLPVFLEAAFAQTLTSQSTANYLPIQVLEDHLIAFSNDQLTSFQLKQLQSKFFAEHKVKVFEGTIKCENVLEYRNNVVIIHEVKGTSAGDPAAFIEVLIPLTDTANVQKAGQIKRGDNVIIRGILTQEFSLERSGYTNVRKRWVAKLEKSSVLSIASSTK